MQPFISTSTTNPSYYQDNFNEKRCQPGESPERVSKNNKHNAEDHLNQMNVISMNKQTGYSSSSKQNGTNSQTLQKKIQ